MEAHTGLAQAIGGGKQHALPGELNLYNADGFLLLEDALALIDAAVDSTLPSSSSSVPSADTACATTSATKRCGMTGQRLSEAVQRAKAVVLALRQVLSVGFGWFSKVVKYASLVVSEAAMCAMVGQGRGAGVATGSVLMHNLGLHLCAQFGCIPDAQFGVCILGHRGTWHRPGSSLRFQVVCRCMPTRLPSYLPPTLPLLVRAQ